MNIRALGEHMLCLVGLTLSGAEVQARVCTANEVEVRAQRRESGRMRGRRLSPTVDGAATGALRSVRSSHGARCRAAPRLASTHASKL